MREVRSQLRKIKKMEANKDSVKKICDIKDVMETFSKYQIMHYMMIFLAGVVITLINTNYVFVVGDMNYRCQIEKCEDANSTVLFPTWWPDTSIERCSSPVLKSGEQFCTNSSFTGEITSCNHWIYESNKTAIAELDLACQPWKTNVVGTIHSMGMLVSLLVFGWISDRFGRKPALIISIVAGSVGILKTIATSYEMFVIIEFIEAVFSGGLYTSSMVLLIEIAGKKYRLLSGVTYAYAIYIGEFVLAFAAMYIPYWRTLIYVINGPCIFFIFLIFFINESPRWQIVNGRIEEAKRIMKKIADVNKIHINNDELQNMDEATLKENFDIKNEVKENLISAFRSKEVAKRLIVACICRFTCSFVYNGMLLNSVWLPGNKYTNFLITAAMSFPGELMALYLMNKIGRKIPVLVGLLTCGVLCAIAVLIPLEYSWAMLTLFFIAKVIISSCLTGVITYSMELFPTSARGSLLGVTGVFSRMGAMLAPLTPILLTVSVIHPFLIFSCSSFLSGLFICFTPETKNMPLFDTIAQVEDYDRCKAKQQP